MIGQAITVTLIRLWIVVLLRALVIWTLVGETQSEVSAGATESSEGDTCDEKGCSIPNA